MTEMNIEGLHLKSVSQRYGDVLALQEISVSLSVGDICALVGPNGSGKTSTLRITAGTLLPSMGSVELRCAGKTLRPEGKEAAMYRANIGFLPEGAPLWESFSTEAFLESIARLRANSSSQAIEDAMILTGLTDVRHRLMGTLSKGFRRRVALAATLLHDPPVLLLDEPSDGLDPNQTDELHRFIRNLGARKIVIISTHDLHEVESICTRAIIINGGRIVANDTIDALRHHSSDGTLIGLFRHLTGGIRKLSPTEHPPINPARS